MKKKPRIIKATMVDGIDEWHIECLFENGERYVPIAVDIERSDLAELICKFLNDLADYGDIKDGGLPMDRGLPMPLRTPPMPKVKPPKGSNKNG